MLRTRLATTKKKNDVHGMKWVQGLPPFNLGLSVIRGSKPPPVRPAILKTTITEIWMCYTHARWINHTHKQKAKHKQRDKLNEMAVGKPW